LISKVGKIGVDFLDAHALGVSFVMEEDVLARPIYVGALGVRGLAARAQLLLHLVEKFWGPVL
jgi:hypothetical protein